FFSSRRRHTRFKCDWSSDVCSSDLVADAAPGAELYVGLKRGVTRDEFQRKIGDGSVAECFHRVTVKPGDAMFLPSGRVHALGAEIGRASCRERESRPVGEVE